MQPAPIVAIVGRPNVGKSTLFNRLIGKRHAIIAEEAGTTRDRIMQHTNINGYEVLLVDTGGLEYGKKENIEEDIQAQSNVAIHEADLILFVIEGGQELTVDDYAAVEILRKSHKDVILIANKCDTVQKMEEGILNVYELGFGEPIAVSAIHKAGIEMLSGTIEKRLKAQKRKKTTKLRTTPEKSICIVGKPNAGKSSLVNALLGSEKVIVSEIPGTTRDTTDTEITYEGEQYLLIDTAGLRRPGKRERGIEKFSAMRTAQAVERSEIVVILIDGTQSITSQDCHIAELALDAHKGLILAINKLDLLDEDQKGILLRRIKNRFSFTPWAPVVFVSAKDKKNIHQLLTLSGDILKEREKRISTAEFNTTMQQITHKHMPASVKTQKPKFFYGSQVDIRPPRFVLFFRNPQNLHFTYPRYLENQIRKKYGFNGTAIEIVLKNKVSEG